MTAPLTFTRQGKRIAILPRTMEAVVEEDEGCTVVKANDTHRLDDDFERVVELWAAELKGDNE